MVGKSRKKRKPPIPIQEDAEKDRLPGLFIWFVWFVLFIWLNETNQMNQINQIIKTNQINQIDQTDRACATRGDDRSSRAPR